MLKDFIKEYQEDIILVIGVILISLLSFAMGYIIAKEQGKEPIRLAVCILPGSWLKKDIR
jgi:hypothetical protein